MQNYKNKNKNNWKDKNNKFQDQFYRKKVNFKPKL